MIARFGTQGSHCHAIAVVAFVLAGLLLVLMGPIPHAAGAPGDQLWLARYTPHTASGEAVATSPDGSVVYVAANANSKLSGSNVVTIAYQASTGAESWVARWDRGRGADDTVFGIAMSPDGARLFVLAQSLLPVGDPDYVTLAYDAATGDQYWVRRYNGPGRWLDVPADIATSPDGSMVFVTGGSQGADMSGDYYTVAYDAVTGTNLWHSRYKGPAESWANASALAVSADGTRLFVTGTRSPTEFATLAYDALSGTRVWLRHFSGRGSFYDFGRDVAVSPDGTRLFVTGEEATKRSIYNFITVAYDANGARLWARRYNGPPNGYDYGQFVAVSPDGTRVYVLGRSDGWNAPDYATVAYDATTGDELWVARYNGPDPYSQDYPAALAVSPDGARVYVTGDSSGPGTVDDYATVAYDAVSGEQMWVQRFNGSGNWVDKANALAVSPDGSVVFVTGYSDKDVVTIAYSTETGSFG